MLLALHFATWVPSLTYTSVASSTALVATQPVWAALIARATGHDVPPRAWVGMAVAFAGVLLLTGIDLTLSTRAVVGDLLALAGAVFAAAYVTVGSRVRQTVTTTTYTFVCYGVCAALLLTACAAGRLHLVGFAPVTWVAAARADGRRAAARALAHQRRAADDARRRWCRWRSCSRCPAPR